MLSKTKKSKIFVLDTNVILHDHTCIYQFQDNDIILPITVLEELDKFKRGNDLINFQAREFTRVLDEIVGDDIFNGGKSLGVGKGRLRIETGKPFSDELKASFREDIPDHRILAIADFTARTYPRRKNGTDQQGHQPSDEGQVLGHTSRRLQNRPGYRREYTG